MKNTEGFNFARTFLKVRSFDFRPAELTPTSLNDLVKLFELFLLPLRAIFFFGDITLKVFLITVLFFLDFPSSSLLEDPGLPKPSEKPTLSHLCFYL